MNVHAYEKVGLALRSLRIIFHCPNSAVLGAAREVSRCMTRKDTPTHEQRNDQYRQKMIGKRLKSLYANLVEQKVPDAFLSLLEQADDKGRP